MKTVSIINYGMGNIGSVENAISTLNFKSKTISNPEDLDNAEKIILPGVGSFKTGMKLLNDGGWVSKLKNNVITKKKPLFGICLGMQLLTQSSEEGTLLGLGWIKAVTKRFPKTSKLKVPHMGWNIVSPIRESPISKNLPDEIRFYFVHSFYVHVENEEDSILKAHYGINFDAAIQHGNIFGAQFHPEKSHKFGRQFLTNFANL